MWRTALVAVVAAILALFLVALVAIAASSVRPIRITCDPALDEVVCQRTASPAADPRSSLRGLC